MTRHGTGAATSQPAVRCAGPGDALDAIPWVLGFHPSESLAMLCLRGPRSAFGPVLRFDLLDPGFDTSVIQELLRLLHSTGCDGALLVVYTDQGSDDPLSQLPRQGLLLEARRQFGEAGVQIKDAVIVRHGRWWSLQCDDPLCCPPEGTAVAHDVPSAIELAYLAAGAAPPLASREALVETLAARPDPEVDAILDVLARDADGLGLDSQLVQLEETWGHAMRQRGQPLEPAAVALLIHLVQGTACRDRAAALPHGDELVEAVAIWQRAYVAAPARCRPQVGSILAVLAWEDGGGALATSICESVLEIDPAHSLTLLVLRLLEHRVQAPPRPTRAEAERAVRSARRAMFHQHEQRAGSRGNGGGRRRLRRLAG